MQQPWQAQHRPTEQLLYTQIHRPRMLERSHTPGASIAHHHHHHLLLLLDGNCCLACRTLVGIHIADLTEHLVTTDRQTQARVALQAVQTLPGGFMQDDLMTP